MSAAARAWRPTARTRREGGGHAVTAAAGAVALVAGLPLLYVLVRAAGAGSETWSLLLDRRIPALLANTIGLAAVVGAATLVLGGGLAWLTVRTDLPARRWLAVLCALPLAIPPYVGAVIYADVLGPRGGLQGALEPLGVERLPSIFGFDGAALVLVLFTYPYVFLLASAGLANLNPHYDEAARALGARPWRVAATTARLLLPALAGGGLLVGLYVLSDFGAVSLMRFDTFTTVIYQQLGGRFDPPGAAALSSVLVVLTLAVLVGGLKLRGGGRYVQTGSGGGGGGGRRA
ncbi:MAG: Ferric iron ABC transporter, permease protein, partial [uncultured Solirubrobacteraceae bacterium]